MARSPAPSLRVGVLALQGGFAPHADHLRALGHRPSLIRSARDVDALEGIVLPGGESTTQLSLLAREPGLRDALEATVRGGIPLLATCAGLILAAREVEPLQSSFGWIDVGVRRNAWGRQLDSAEAVADDGTPLVLIRAPRILRVGAGVSVEATLDGEPVLVRQGSRWGATFHPELTRQTSLHARAFGDPRGAREGSA
ncbi:MAG: pyridoxal 5'-phosphate synthase glutaminase subunit PdxT [Sandaracinaceae bacterium]